MRENKFLLSAKKSIPKKIFAINVSNSLLPKINEYVFLFYFISSGLTFARLQLAEEYQSDGKGKFGFAVKVNCEGGNFVFHKFNNFFFKKTKISKSDN